LLAGRTLLQNGNKYILNAYTDLYNWTLFPLLESSLDADTVVEQTNQIQIDNGAVLEMVGNATFAAATGTVIIYGQGRGHDLYREAGEAILGDGVSFAIENGSATDSHSNGVIVNGTVRVGTQNKLAMTLSGTTAAPVITADAGITYTYTKESLVLNLQADQARLQQLKQEYKGTDAEAAFDAQLALIEQQLDDLGFCSPQFANGVDSSGGYVTVCETDIPVYYVTVDDIRAQSSNIIVEADYFYANGNTGKLYAPGDAEITITNNGPFSLRFNRVVIPDATGGRIIFNDDPLVDANGNGLEDEINNRNPLLFQTADFHTIQSIADSNPPTITITSTYAAAGNEVDPDIEFTGDVFAPSRFAQGVIYVENVNGSIYVKNVAGATSVNIEAFEVTLKAGKNFVQEYKPGFTNIGGQPEGHWASVANASEAFHCDRSEVCWAIPALDDSTAKGGSGNNYIFGNIVLISGEFLNINGTVQSGLADRSLVLNSVDQTLINSFKSNYDSAKSAGGSPTETLVLRQSIEFTVVYNAASDRIEVSNVVVQGGYMELYGLIMSTGNGNIKVLDGYGRIVIDNQTNKNLFINQLDTGSGTEGELIITDTQQAKVVRTLASGSVVTRNRAVRYTRAGSAIQIFTNTAYDNPATTGNDESFDWVDVTNVADNIPAPSGADNRVAYYSPVSGLAYTWVTGQRKLDQYWYKFETSSWLGVDAFAKDPGASSDSSTKNIDAVTLSEGNYVDSTSPAEGEYSYTYERLVISTAADCAASGGIYQSSGYYAGKCQIAERHTSRRSGFLGLGKTYTDQYWFEQTYKDIHTHSVSADNIITITFIGFDSGTLNVTSNAGIIIGADINNPSGTTTLTANSGSITVEAENVTLTSNTLTLSATTGIGAQGFPIQVDMQAGVLNATTTSGDIYISEVSNNLNFNQITTGNGDVILHVQQNLVPENTSALIQGGLIKIYSELGSVGSSPTLPVRINMGENNLHDYLLVEAAGHVFIEEISGDLRLMYIRTNLDVYVKVANGSLLDRRSGSTPDIRQDLVDLWDSLNLRAEDGADAQPAIDAHIAMINNDYQTYWYYRDNGTALSSTLETSMLAAGYTAADVALQNTKRADEYAALQARFDVMGGTQITGWDYSTDTNFYEPAFDNGANTVNAGANTIYFANGHIYRDGTKVMYDANGGTVIPGLVDGKNYIVNVVDDHTIQLSLYKDGANEIQDIGSLGSGTHTLSEVKAIESTAVWSDADARYALTGGWLKTVSDTQTQQEDPNITGRNITIITVGGGVGQNNGVDVIDLTNLGSITDAQKVKLASTERVDAIIINPTNDTINFGYAHGKSAGDAISFPGILGISGLSASVSDGVTYYVVEALKANSSVDPLALKLATTQALALTGTSDVDLTVRKIYIIMKDDIDLELTQPLTSVLNVTSDAEAYIGSEQAIRIDRIATGDETRIKSSSSIIDAASTVSPNVSITDGNLVLEAGSNSVGSATDFIEVSMSNTASLTARAGDSVYVRGVSGVTDNLYLDTIYAVNYIDLQGINIYDSYNDDSSGGYLNIKTVDLNIAASCNIGTSANYVEMDMDASGHLTASSTGCSIYLGETLGSMNVDRVTALAGNVGLRAQSSIYDWNQDLAADVSADDVTLEAYLGEIGQLLGGSNDGNFEINSDTAGGIGSGVLTTYTKDDLNLMETSGSLYLWQVETGYGTAYITSPASIYNANGGTCNSASTAGCSVVTGIDTLPGKTRLYANTDIGTDASPITSNVGRVEGVAQSGCFILRNQGALISGGVTNATTSIEAGTCIKLIAQSPVTVEVSQIAHTGDIVIVSEDNGATDFVYVNPGVTLEATTGTVWLRGGDTVTLPVGAIITAGVAAKFSCEDSATGDSDPQGCQINLYGQINTPQLTIIGGNDNDTINIDPEMSMPHTTYTGGAGDDTITLQKMLPTFNASETIDLNGQGGSDHTIIYLAGDSNYIVNLTDSGAEDDGVDRLTIYGVDSGAREDDLFLLRKNMVALINEGIDGNSDTYDDVERINYTEQINGRLRVNSMGGDDAFYMDDNSSITTLDGGIGNDLFQFGQLFKSARDSAAAILAGDEFATVETTRGFLSNGASNPVTAYGGTGEDTFQVYHNLAVLRLEGGADNDSFIVRAFVVLDEAAKQAMTFINSGEGADKIQYVINAPVSIDGGDGFDTVVIIGTEFHDNFVITKDGVFGAGLNVTYENIEQLEVDGMEGDDNFFVISTNEDWSAIIVGNLGSDTININGDIDVDIVSLDLLGLSSAIHHAVITQDPYYSLTVVEDVLMHAVTTSDPSVVITESENYTQTDELTSSGTTDTFEISLSKAPTSNVYLTVSAPLSQYEEMLAGGKTAGVSKDGGTTYDFAVVLAFTPGDYSTPQQVTVRAEHDLYQEGDRFVEVSSSINSADTFYNDLAIRNVRVRVRDNDRNGLVLDQIEEVGSTIDNETVIVESGGSRETDSYKVSLTHAPTDDVTVTLSLDSLSTGEFTLTNAATFQTELATISLTFTPGDWNTAQIVQLKAIEDNTPEGKQSARVLHTLASSDSDFNNIQEKLDLVVFDKATVVITETNGSTFVVAGPGASTADRTDTYTVVLTSSPEAAGSVNVTTNDFDLEGELDTSSVTITVDPSNGTAVFDAQTGLVTYTPDSGHTGADSFTYQICDTQNNCSTAVVQVNTNPAGFNPISVDDDATTTEDTAYDYDVLTNDTVNGTTPTISFVTDPENGTAAIMPANGVILTQYIEYLPDANFNGNDLFQYMLCNESSACDVATARITVNPDNDAPITSQDVAVTDLNTAIAVDVTANDYDVEGSMDTASVTVVTGPTNGTYSIDPVLGIITYTPATAYTGFDSLSYQVCDVQSACSAATVLQLFVNGDDSLDDDDKGKHYQNVNARRDNANLGEDDLIDIDVIKNDKEGAAPLAVQYFSSPLNGMVTLETSGKLRYTPNANFHGEDRFSYMACDKDPLSCDVAEVVVTVDPADDKPLAANDLLIVDSTVIVQLSWDDHGAYDIYGPSGSGSIDLYFDASNWNVPQTVTVEASASTLPSGDATIMNFASSSHRVDQIRGPIEVLGGVGTGDRSLRGPVMLPHETNDYIPTGTVSSFTSNTLVYVAAGINDDLNDWADKDIMWL
ncbi:MAG: tandem-95 repeat protein, partial [Chloroflexi bacterium]|nr:tandem-95 repeat protein [Chloroflexota bacterium]